MARVNIEDSFFLSGKINQIASALNWSYPETLGRIVLLWHRSQACKITQCDPKDLILFMDLNVRSDLLNVVDTLLAFDVLRSTESGKLHICGNEKHITALNRYIEAGKQSGRARKQRSISNGNNSLFERTRTNVERTRTNSNETLTGTSTIAITGTNTETKTYFPPGVADNVELRSTRSPIGEESEKKGVDNISFLDENGIINKTLQTSTSQQIQKIKKPTKKKQETNTASCWAIFDQEYKTRYGVTPLRNVQTNSQMKKIVSLVGEELAGRIIKHYIFSNNAYYIQRTHSVGIMLADIQKLRVEVLSGEKITRQKAHEAEQREDFVNRMEALKEKLRQAQETENKEKENDNVGTG